MENFIIHFRHSTVGKNLENFAILNSTVENPTRTAFNFTAHLQKLLLRQVRFTRVNTRLFSTETLFNVNSKLAMFEISNCDIGNINFTFLNAETVHGKIVNNQFRLSQERAFDLKANNMTIVNNTIDTDTKGSIVITVFNDLLIEDNEISNTDDHPQEHPLEHAHGLHNIFQLGKEIGATLTF